MESVVDGNGGSGGLVVMELSLIKELVRQLEGHLGGAQTQEVCKHLASQISSLTERSITLVTSSALAAGARKRSAAAHSPLSDTASDAPFKATNKKRKTAEKVKHQVKVSSAAAGDAPADDGHSWRKYGQKEILGAKHPRAYYRCTHRHSQGCAATKQVQRTDEDPALFDVVYIGEHTCVQRPAAAGQPEQKQDPNAHSLLQSLSSNLTVKTDGLAVAPPEEAQQGWIAGAATTPFCLSSTPAASGCLAPSTSDNWGVVSPATSDSDRAASLPPLEAVAAGEVRFGEVMSALVDIPDEFADFDISSFLV